MMNGMRSLLATAAIASIVCTGAASAADEYEIGITGDLSGGSAGTYKPLAEGARVYFDQVNDQGGINGHKVKLITRDDRGDPNQVIADLNYFSSEGAIASILAAPSGVLGGYVKQNGSLKIPTIYINACYPPSTPPHADANFFCPGISTLTDAYQAVDLMAKLMEGQKTKLAFLTTDIPGARGAAEKIMKPYAEKKGLEVVDVAVMPVTSTDASVIARKFQDQGVNAVISYTISSHMLAGAAALSQLGWDGKYLLALYLPGVYQQMTELKNEHIYGFDHFSLPSDGKPIDNVMADAAKKFGFGGPLPDLRMGYRDGMVLGAALKACGWPCDRDHLRETMNHLTVDSQDVLDLNLNPVIFTPTNHTSPEKVYRVYHWSKEKGAVVPAMDSVTAKENDWK